MAKGNKVAIQNFSGGGFYGKLGVIVGQRLYDRFIMRAYTKTPNPNTPAQKKARGDFGRTSKRASFALNINPRSPQITTTKMPAMAARNKIACALEKSGAQDLDLLPIFEADKTPDYLVNQIQLVNQSATTARFLISGNLPSVSRGISAVFILNDEDFELSNCKITNGEFLPNGTTYNLELQKAAEWTFDANTRIVLITNDDKQNNDTFLWLPCSYIAPSPIPERAFDFTISRFSRNGNIFELEFSENYFENVQSFSNFSLHCVSNGSFGDFSIESPTMINLNGHFGIRFSCTASNEWETWAFPNGSKFSITNLEISSDTLILKAQNVENALTSSDLTRSKETSIYLTTSYFDANSKNYYIETYNFALPKAICDAVAIYDSETEHWKLPETLQENFERSPTVWLTNNDGEEIFYKGIEYSFGHIDDYDPAQTANKIDAYFEIEGETTGDDVNSSTLHFVQSGKYFFEDWTVQNVIYRIKINCPLGTEIAVM